MTQSEAKKPQRNLVVLAAVALVAVAFVVFLIVTTSGTAAEGKWLRVDPRNNSYPGDYLVIEGATWHMTGNPAMSGKVKIEGGDIHLLIEKVGDQTRAEAVQAHESVEEKLKDLDAQLVFRIEKEGNDTLLKQVGKPSGFAAEWRFERMPSER